MRVTDEMVEAGAKGFWEMVKRGAKWEDVSPSIREDWLMSSRAVLTAALSHAAGQEGDTFVKAYSELARAVGRAGFHINCDNGTLSLVPKAPPTTSAEVGPD